MMASPIVITMSRNNCLLKTPSQPIAWVISKNTSSVLGRLWSNFLEQDVLLPWGDRLPTVRVFFFFHPYWKHLICCQTICKGKKHGLPSEAPWRLKPENSRTYTQYEKSKLNNGFTRAPSHVTLNQSKGKFTKIKAVKGTFIWKVLINLAKPSFRN